MHNQFVKQLTTREIDKLINYVFTNVEPGMVTQRDDTLSAFTVYYDFADAELTVAIDDFEGFAEQYEPPIPRPGSYMTGEQQLRFQAWMYQRFKAGYMKELTRFLRKKYNENR